jgi:hypothetical protein
MRRRLLPTGAAETPDEEHDAPVDESTGASA